MSIIALSTEPPRAPVRLLGRFWRRTEEPRFRRSAIFALKDESPPPSSTGIWVVLASISMIFAAFTSAMVVRQGAAMDWQHLTLPHILYLNTLVLLASSITLEMARRRFAADVAGSSDKRSPSRWLYATLGLGMLFVAGQYLAWLQLRAQGLYLATNPNSSFFYVLTAIHAIHVLAVWAGWRG